MTLTEILGEDATELTEAAEHLRLRGRIEFSVEGHLIAVHGLCRRPTPHRIEHHDGVVNTWCALDAIGIPPALGIDALAVTRCPSCQGQLAVRLSAGEPQPLPEATLWYPGFTSGHLVEDFCSGANLFCSIDHLERWAGDRGLTGRAMPVAEAAELGRDIWAEVAELLRTEASETSAWGGTCRGAPTKSSGGYAGGAGSRRPNWPPSTDTRCR